MAFFSFLGSTTKIKEALRNGAVIIDVRTAQEYDSGHIPDAVNIPVDRIVANTERIKVMKRPVVLCCNSGTRSSQAQRQLKVNGLTEVYNGGNWQHVLKIIHRL